MPRCGLRFHRWGHIQSFDKGRMQELIQRAGLAVERLQIDTFIDWRRRGGIAFCKSAIRLVFARLGEPLADPHLIAIARKRGAARGAS